MGYGAALTATAFLICLCHGLAARGWCRGDAFVVSSIGIVIALIAVFVFFPVSTILASAFGDDAASSLRSQFLAKFFDRSVWGLDCLMWRICAAASRGTRFSSRFSSAFGTTALGLAFALIATRTSFRFKSSLRVLTVLPIITPPFVIGLALILLFGRSGAVTALLFDWFGVAPSRWIYGLPGVFIAQLLAFTPIAFLVLIGVVQGISPSLEEASQTLRARRWTDVRDGDIAADAARPRQCVPARLRREHGGFRQSARARRQFRGAVDKIFFAVVGAAQDQGARRRAVDHPARLHARRVLAAACAGSASSVYTTVTGKGDSGIPLPLPRRVAWLCYRHRDPVGDLHLRDLRDHPRRRLRQVHGTRLHADARTLSHRLSHRDDADCGLYLLRLGLEFVLRDHRDRRDFGAARPRRSACSPPSC